MFDIDISRIVTECRAQILADEKVQRVNAPFPAHLTKAVQNDNGVKAQSVYLSQYQLIPYQRLHDYFQEQASLPISTGSIVMVNKNQTLSYKILAQIPTGIGSPILNAFVCRYKKPNNQ